MPDQLVHEHVATDQRYSLARGDWHQFSSVYNIWANTEELVSKCHSSTLQDQAEDVHQRAYVSAQRDNVDVTYQQNHYMLPLLVEGNGPSPFGRSWLQHIESQRELQLFRKCPPLPLIEFLDCWESRRMSFRSKMQPFKATLCLESDAQPRLHKPRSVQSSQVSHTVRETHANLWVISHSHTWTRKSHATLTNLSL